MKAPNTQSPREAALAYAAAGYPVHPVDGKIPLTKWKDAATTDPAIITAWFDRWPHAGVALVTGERSGLFVVDLDIDKETGECTGESEAERLGLTECFADAPKVRTKSGGLHVFFRAGDDLDNSASKIAAAIDTRGKGGFVVAAGSPGYQWLGSSIVDLAPPPVPAKLRAMIEAAGAKKAEPVPPASNVVSMLPMQALARQIEAMRPTAGSANAWAEQALNAEIGRVMSAGPGTRNQTLNRSSFAIGQIVAGGGLDRTAAEEALARAGRAIGLEADEITKTIASGFTAGAAEPRTAPERAQDRVQVSGAAQPHTIFPNGFRLQSSAEFVADYTPPDYLIDGNLRRGWLYTLTAPTGHGKTAAMLTLAHCIATGAEFCGREVSQGAVLYLAGENPDDVQARYIGLLDYRHDDAAKLPILFHGGTFSIRRDFDAMRSAIEAAGRQLAIVVVDTLAAYFDGDDLNSNAQQQEFATNVLRPLTTLPGRPCVVVPAHPVKNAAKNNLVPMGGSALLNQVDGNMTAWNEGGVVSLHWQGKFRGAAWEPMQLELVGHTTPKLMDSKGRCIPTVIANEVTVTRAIDLSAQHESRENRALELILANPNLSDRGLADALGIGKTAANAIKKDLIARKWIVARARKHFLTDEGKEVLAP